MLVSRTWQFSAIAASVANSTAFLFSTGNAPGNPRHTGQTLVLGGAPNVVEHPQKALVAVSSWTWTSSPITTSYFWMAAESVSDAVAMVGIINGAIHHGGTEYTEKNLNHSFVTLSEAVAFAAKSK